MTVGLSKSWISDLSFKIADSYKPTLLYSNTQSIVGFSVIPECVTLDDLERPKRPSFRNRKALWEVAALPSTYLLLIPEIEIVHELSCHPIDNNVVTMKQCQSQVKTNLAVQDNLHPCDTTARRPLICPAAEPTTTDRTTNIRSQSPPVLLNIKQIK